jgi:ketosteroid isomerase-like protein
MDRATCVRETWDSIARGDLGPLQAALAPDAQWRAVEDGPWNCRNRKMILATMGRNLANGLSGQIEEIIDDHDDRLIVAFQPDSHGDGAWPLDNGIRYLVLTLADGRVTEMKGCADRQTALAYAAS